jgi:hypothetical protein
VHKHPRLALSHRWKDGAIHAHGPEQVCLEKGLPLFDAKCLCCAYCKHPRVINQHINFACIPEGLFDSLRN